MKYYSPSHRGFFDEHPPKDAVDLTEEEYSFLMAANRGNPGISMDIVPGPDGKPIAVPFKPVVTSESLRATRNALLSQTDRLVARHRDEMESGKTTLTDEQYQTLQRYRRELRDLPENPDFPACGLPESPAFLKT